MLLKTKFIKLGVAAIVGLALLVLVGLSLTGALAIQTDPAPATAGNSDPEAYAAWRNQLLQDENGTIPDNALEKALAEKEKLAQAQDQNGAPGREFAGVYPGGWEELGPNNIGGRVRALAIHPITPTIMWAGTAGGGIWKSADGGASWFSTKMNVMPVSSLVLDPDNPDILYAGTGEGFYNQEAIRGNGIYKSTNGGLDWTQLSATTGANFQYVNRLAITKISNQTVILAATRAGIFRSSDNGTTWPTTNLATGVLDIEVNPNNSSLMVASSDSGRAWYSSDGGLNWTASNFVNAVSTNSVARVELSYAKTPSGTVFASINTYQGDAGGNQVYGEIYRSTNNGQSFTRVNSGDGYLGQKSGLYANSIWVDPTDGNRVLVGGVDLWRSTNALTTSVRINQISRGALNPANPGYYNHVIVAHPGYNGTSNRTVFVAGDGGIYKTNDILNTSPTSGWQNLNNGLAITQLFDAAVNPQTGVLYAGSQGNGLLRYTSNSFGWQRHSGAAENQDIVSVELDPTDSNWVYATGQQLTVVSSSNAGATTDFINTGITEAISDQSNRFSPILIDPNNPKTMYAGGQSVWKTVNVTATVPLWQNVRPSSGGCGPTNCIRAMAIDNSNSDNMWIGYGDGKVFMTTEATLFDPFWTIIDDNTTKNPLPNRAVTSIYLSQAVTKPVYITFGGYNTGNLYRTINGGTNWTPLQTGLPAAPIYTIVEHPNNPNWLYVGTEVGLFTSENGGSSWNAVTDGPNNAPVYKLFWRGTTLYASTLGRGIFKMDVPGNVPNLLNVGVAFDDATLGNGNNRIDPNEKLNLQLTLRNNGAQTASAISSSLVVTSGNAQVLTGTAAYPNLPAYGGTAANQVSYTLFVNPNLPCSDKIYLQQTVYYNTNLTKTFSIVLAVGTLQNNPYQTFTYSGASVAIPDNAPTGVDIPLAVNKTGVIGDINVSLNITHTFDSDLSVSLIAPNGQSVLLVSKRGSSGQNFTNTLLDDEATADVSTGSAPFTGSYQPEQLLSTLDGLPISGTWKLRVVDTADGQIGGVISYSLLVQERLVTCVPVPGDQPNVTSLFPPATNAGSNGLTLAVYGTSFFTNTVARWNGADLPTTYVSPTLLLAQIDAAKVASPGVVPVSAYTPDAAGQPGSANFTINTVCDRLVVSSAADSNACGTLRDALTYLNTAGISNTQITLALSAPATITLSLASALPPLESGSSLLGICHPLYGPGVTLNGSGVTDGLTAQGNNTLRGLRIFGFGGKQLTLTGLNVKMQCMSINEN